MVKPFSATELVARVEAALRKWTGSDEPFSVGELAINHAERRVSLAGRVSTLDDETIALHDRLRASRDGHHGPCSQCVH